VRHGLTRLQPPQFNKVGLDEADVIAREIDSYDDARKVITGYRFLAFAHRAPLKKGDKGDSLTSLRKTAKDDFLPLGVIASSQGLRLEAMVDKVAVAKAENMPNGTPAQKTARAAAIENAERMLPPGEYTVLFKAEGESKAYKEKQKHRGEGKSKEKDKAEPAKPEGEDKPDAKNGKADKKAKDDKKDKDGEGEPAAEEAPIEAMMPWPGLASIHELEEDIDYPQDVDLILFLNSNNVVVGFAKPESITEEELAPAVSTRSDDGKEWTLEFSLNQQTSKKGPRFKFGLELGGEGL
jgi:hypothetical protein